MEHVIATVADRKWTLAGQPGRGDSCNQCYADLRVCLNCVSYDPHIAYQCRDRRAKPVPGEGDGKFLRVF